MQAGGWGTPELQLGHAVRTARAWSRAGEGQIRACGKGQSPSQEPRLGLEGFGTQQSRARKASEQGPTWRWREAQATLDHPQAGLCIPSSPPFRSCSASHNSYPGYRKGAEGRGTLGRGRGAGGRRRPRGGRTYSGDDNRGGEKRRGGSVRAGEPEVTQANQGALGPRHRPHPIQLGTV